LNLRILATLGCIGAVSVVVPRMLPVLPSPACRSHAGGVQTAPSSARKTDPLRPSSVVPSFHWQGQPAIDAWWQMLAGDATVSAAVPRERCDV